MLAVAPVMAISTATATSRTTATFGAVAIGTTGGYAILRRRVVAIIICAATALVRVVLLLAITVGVVVAVRICHLFSPPLSTSRGTGR